MRFYLFIYLNFCLIQVFSQNENVFLLDSWKTSGLPTTYDGESVYNEVWGFVENEIEYAVIASTNGTHFFRISDENKLVYIDFISGRYSGTEAVHRDYHDYNGYLYAVCDENASSLQIIDLQYLPDSVSLVYDEDSLIVRSHNIFIDSASALLYSCSNTTNTGFYPLSVYDISNNYAPSFISSYELVGHVHDAFVRNDTAYFNCGGEGLRVLDYTNPYMPLPLGQLSFYTDKGYNHAGWLSEDGNTYVLCDETVGMRVKVLDVSDLSDIKVASLFSSGFYDQTLPHNVILKDGIAYLSYYNDGLQIFNVRDIYNPQKLAYYDSYQGSNDNTYRGVWGVYPLLPSGRILISDRLNGLLLLGFNAPPKVNLGFQNGTDFIIFPNPTSSFAWFYHKHIGSPDYKLSIYSILGQLLNEYQGNQDYLLLDCSKYSIGTYIYKYQSNLSDIKFTGEFIVTGASHP